jgi:hypothetical protein
MYSPRTKYFLAITLSLCFISAVPVQAQDSSPQAGDSDESTQRVEESEEAYRRRMELEGARDHDTFSNTSYASQAKQQKIDKLPEESQRNIRDQITDIIIENGEWKPGDVLEEYSYEPTKAAGKNPVLLEQEEEAWAEQVEKYHEREAAAFGATRPAMPGSDTQQAGTGSSGDGHQAGEQGGGQNGSGQDGSQGGPGSAGSYQPYQSPNRDDDDEISTAGVSESALDFLRGKQGQAPGSNGSDSEQQGQAPKLAGEGNEPQDDSTETSPESGDSPEQAPDGSLPIEQLEQLQGVTAQSTTRQPDTSPAPEEALQVQTAGAETQPEHGQGQEHDQAQADQQDQQFSQEQASPQQQTSMELDLSSPGIIAIRDLDKLEGVEEPEQEEEP